MVLFLKLAQASACANTSGQPFLASAANGFVLAKFEFA
jgi:hypothetical protein